MLYILSNMIVRVQRFNCAYTVFFNRGSWHSRAPPAQSVIERDRLVIENSSELKEGFLKTRMYESANVMDQAVRAVVSVV